MAVHLIETSEEDSYLAVARHISDLLNEGQARTALAETPGSKFIQDSEAALAEGRFGDLLNLLVPHFDVLFQKTTGSDLECCVNVISHLVPRLPPHQVRSAAKQVADALTATVDEQAQQRLGGLTELYNVADDAKTQHMLLQQAIAYATKANLANLLGPVIKNRIEEWIKDWRLSPADSRDLYLDTAALLRTNKRRKTAAKDAYKLTLRCLSTFDDSSPEDVVSVKATAAQAVSEFIRSPDLFQFDLFESPTITQLKGDSEYGHLYQLLEIILNGNLSGYESFDKSKLENTSEEDVQTKVRLTALMTLGTRSTHELKFAEVQQALGLGSDSEVEAWVVRAIGKRLLEGRINQLKQTVTITKCAHRIFAAAQWQELKQQLAAWKDNVQQVEQLINQQIQESDSSNACSASTRLSEHLCRVHKFKSGTKRAADTLWCRYKHVSVPQEGRDKLLMRSSAPESMEDASDSANESDSDDSSADPLARPSRPSANRAASSDTRNQQSRKKAPNMYQTLHKVFTVPAEQVANIGKLMGYKGKNINHITSTTGCCIIIGRGRVENEPVPVDIWAENHLDLSEAVRMISACFEEE
ncbi:hypothetical protein WJX79_008396 [Trebouxia sp. C0005]